MDPFTASGDDRYFPAGAAFRCYARDAFSPGKGSAVQRKHDIRGAGIACRAVILTAALLLFGCSYKSEVPIPTAAATATPARAVSRPTSVYLAPEIALLARDATVDSDFCRAFDFPVEIGPALAGALRAENAAALRTFVPGGSADHVPAAITKLTFGHLTILSQRLLSWARWMMFSARAAATSDPARSEPNFFASPPKW